ncbi:probable disease resistance protein At4g27220 [Neltuma alba]|uniref:probable disease resistance protein At4g27220 n=1 Tax=Neltuma alba TaxID=207710 RepID=UPI0010A2E30C|nr:probable disease resistance protein At4g27220 [Prosopis alba]
MNNEASTIGIWGMGGTGKTALATLVNNKLLEEAGDDFDHIIWVTMSQSDNRVYQLQKAIAGSINLDISDECDLKRISGKLLQASRHIKRCLLILDNVWDPIFLEEVGFPLSNDGIKLILTTRSWEVCQNMNCTKKTINIKPLDEEDSWDLFEKTLGIHQIQSSRVEPIARAMAKQCEGLPLAIITIARSMRGKEDYLREWNHMLEGMLEDMDERIFSALKSSYACLNNKLQRLFLYYALTAKENVRGSDVELLIRRFFSMGWTDETDSLEMQYDECYTMLHKLKNSSLLMEKNGRWRMHTLFRAMAINITKETEEIMVKPSRNLVQLPENGGWKENLQKVFLTESNVQKILDGTSPKCSRLSTLLLDCNYDLKWIPDDFLSNMVALEILDLSWTGIKRLPESLSNLDCLVALLLSGCTELSYVPSLAKLQRLIELDLSLTAITEAPGGLELLVNLKCLNLADTEQLKMSSSAISKMINLLSLKLMNWIPDSMNVSAQDLQGLRKLKVMSVSFGDTGEFNTYVKSLDKDHMPKSYCLSSARLYDRACFEGALEENMKRVVLCGISLRNKTELPEDVKELIISGCDRGTEKTCLCSALSLCKSNDDVAEIEWLNIKRCRMWQSMGCASPDCLFCGPVQLVRLSLEEVEDLEQILAPSSAAVFYSPFLYLRDLYISGCNKMKILITQELFGQLKELETIFVEYCESMEEIVEENSGSIDPNTLPKVRRVELIGLPELRSVFRGTMHCPSLKYFAAYHCEKLSIPPHIEIVQGYKLHMEKTPTRYYWKCDDQVNISPKI